MGFFLRLFTLIASALLVSACATSSAEKSASCDERDWFELGRHDGAQGSSSAELKKHSLACSKEFNSQYETMYTNGRNAGLVEYCTPENAFELGRMGIAYMFVCPSTMEPKFLGSYRKGQRARELEIKNKTIDGRIDTLSEQINQSSNYHERSRLTVELAELKAERTKNQREMDRAYSSRQ